MKNDSHGEYEYDDDDHDCNGDDDYNGDYHVLIQQYQYILHHTEHFIKYGGALATVTTGTAVAALCR